MSKPLESPILFWSWPSFWRVGSISKSWSWVIWVLHTFSLLVVTVLIGCRGAAHATWLRDYYSSFWMFPAFLELKSYKYLNNLWSKFLTFFWHFSTIRCFILHPTFFGSSTATGWSRSPGCVQLVPPRPDCHRPVYRRRVVMYLCGTPSCSAAGLSWKHMACGEKKKHHDQVGDVWWNNMNWLIVFYFILFQIDPFSSRFGLKPPRCELMCQVLSRAPPREAHRTRLHWLHLQRRTARYNAFNTHDSMSSQ